MSELVITAAGFTPQPVTNLHNGPAILRWAYNRQFLDSDGIQVMSGTVSSGFGVEVACAIADGLVTVDEDSSLRTTDNAQDPSPASIWVSAWLLTPRRVLIAQLLIAGKTQFIVPSSLIPTTTWPLFSNRNQAVSLANAPVTFYTAAQIDRLVRQWMNDNPASDLQLGTVILTVPADIPASPVVWGANDPLVRDAVSIEGVAVSDTPPLDGQVLIFNEANNQWEPSNQAAGTGNVVSNEIVSVDGEGAVFSGTGGKTIRRLTGSGLVLATSGVLAPQTATAATALLNNVVGDSGSGGIKGLAPAPAAGDAASGKFLKADGTYQIPSGTGGDIFGPASATDNAITRFDLATGKLVQNSTVTVDDAGLIAGATVTDPTTAQQIGSKNYIDSAVAVVAGNIPKISGLASGGIVFWESAYTFRVSAATYYIQGLLYSSTEQTITLTAAHATLDRIDVLALNTSGTLVKIDGTAAAQPSEPDYDPSTQLKLTFVFVGASTTQPAGVSNEDVYLENTEWTSSTSGSGWNANSTNNPYSGTKDIEGTNVANAAYVQLQRGSSTALDSFATLTMFIRSKATWGNNRVLRVQFFLSGVAKGTAVTIASGYWGFNSSTTGAYQFLAIPMAQFVIPSGQLINQLRITDSGGSIGMYVDNIVLQANGTSIGPPAPVTGITQLQADARYLQIGNNLSDVLVDATARTNIGIGSNVPTTVQGDVLYGSAANTISTLAKDTNATRYLSNMGASNNPAWAQVAVSTGVSGLGTNVATFLGTPSSANLAAALTDETGSGAAVFATSPTLVTPALGTPSSGTLSACTVDGTNLVGFRNIPINSQSTAYSTVLADGGSAVLHPVADNNARTFTIDGAVSYPVGTAITFINMINTLSVAISTDTLTLLGAGTTGTRTLAAYGIATAVKIASGSWVISGTNLT